MEGLCHQFFNYRIFPIIFRPLSQDSVLQLLSPALQSAFEGQKSKWIHSQNASVAAIDASDLNSLKRLLFIFFCGVTVVVGLFFSNCHFDLFCFGSWKWGSCCVVCCANISYMSCMVVVYFLNFHPYLGK